MFQIVWRPSAREDKVLTGKKGWGRRDLGKKKNPFQTDQKRVEKFRGGLGGEKRPIRKRGISSIFMQGESKKTFKRRKISKKKNQPILTLGDRKTTIPRKDLGQL